MENSRGFNSAANNGGQSSRRRRIQAYYLSRRVADLIRHNDWALADEALQESGLLPVTNDPYLLFQAARVSLSFRKLDDAEAYLKRALNKNPDNNFCLQLMGDVLVEKGDHAAAKTYYFRAIQSAEKDSRGRPEIPMGKMIQTLRLQGRNEDALHVTEDLNLRYPCDIPGWRLKCEILRDLERLDEALKTLEHLTQRYPHNSTFAELQRDIAHQANNGGQPASGPVVDLA
jgi:predicted Zn-dependent protease